MSVLIEALRTADAARGASEVSDRPAAAAPPVPAPRPGRLVWRIAAAAVGAVAALAFATLWFWTRLDVEPSAPTAAAHVQASDAPAAVTAGAPDAEAAADENTGGAAAAKENGGGAAAATPAPTPPRPRQAHRPAARESAAPPAPAGATASAEAAPASAASVANVERSEAPDPQRAWEALRAGRLAEAQRLYEALLARQPQQPDALLGLAAVAEARGDLPAAAAGYRRVLQADPDNADALAALAELTAAGDVDAQLSVLRVAIARRPAAASLHAAHGRLLALADRWSEARRAFEAAAALAPHRGDYVFNLAVALDRLGERAQARAQYLRAVDLGDREPVAGLDIERARQRARELEAVANQNPQGR